MPILPDAKWVSLAWGEITDPGGAAVPGRLGGTGGTVMANRREEALLGRSQKGFS